MENNNLKYLYRYERNHFQSEFDSKATIHLEKFIVIKETEKGFWILDNFTGYKRWVSKTSKKRFAYININDAYESFQFRTARCIKILKARLAIAIEFSKAEQTYPKN